MTIPQISLARIDAGDPDAVASLARAAREVGFLTLTDTGLSDARLEQVFAAYRAFFALPEAEKRAVDMSLTAANRGWGAPRSEQVDPEANPDYKQVFDMGFTLPEDDPDAHRAVYAPNRWPARPEGFRDTVEAYYADALWVARRVLRGLAAALGEDASYFDDKFDRPMALLRGNYYPERPDWAGEKDFGIAAHTDYGCLTLLASDGVPGLEVMGRDGAWVAVNVQPGTFVINFGEMLEMWTEGRVRATLHRVRGSSEERISIPLFFNPNYDTNVAPTGSDRVILAGEHLSKRFEDTYLHMKAAS